MHYQFEIIVLIRCCLPTIALIDMKGVKDLVNKMYRTLLALNARYSFSRCSSNRGRSAGTCRRALATVPPYVHAEQIDIRTTNTCPVIPLLRWRSLGAVPGETLRDSHAAAYTRGGRGGRIPHPLLAFYYLIIFCFSLYYIVMHYKKIFCDVNLSSYWILTI
jgi:hypothetical protein